MNAPKQSDLLKSLDRVIEQLENKLKSSRMHASLITSHPDKESGILALKLEAAK